MVVHSWSKQFNYYTMKNKFYLLILGVLCVTVSCSDSDNEEPVKQQEEVVNIPDAKFKAILLADTEININKDNEIQVSEAAKVTGTLGINDAEVTDLTGIEAFIGIDYLNIDGCQLTTVDLSKNVALEILSCLNNKLTALDLTSNLALRNLRSDNNLITSLDLSVNKKLTYVTCDNNKLESLNVKNGTNDIMEYFNVKNNSTLTCIQVDSKQNSDSNTQIWLKDTSANFNENCN